MKKYFLLSTLILVSLFVQSCEKEEPVEQSSEWAEFCRGYSGGQINAKVDGKNWSSNCVQTSFAQYDNTKILYMYAYNYGSTFRNAADIEVVLLVHSETTVDGVTEKESAAVFYDGFYNDSPGSGTYENAYASEEVASDDMTITQLTSDQVKGNFKFTLINEDDDSDQISLTGSFDANIEM